MNRLIKITVFSLCAFTFLVSATPVLAVRTSTLGRVWKDEPACPNVINGYGRNYYGDSCGRPDSCQLGPNYTVEWQYVDEPNTWRGLMNSNNCWPEGGYNAPRYTDEIGGVERIDSSPEGTKVNIRMRVEGNDPKYAISGWSRVTTNFSGVQYKTSEYGTFSTPSHEVIIKEVTVYKDGDYKLNHFGWWSAYDVGATCKVQGYKVRTDGQSNSTVNSQKVSISGDSSTSSTSNPFNFELPVGNYNISVPSLSGYTIGYTKCDNSTGCHNNAPTNSRTVSVSCKANEYVDLYWHYEPSGSISCTSTFNINPSQSSYYRNQSVNISPTATDSTNKPLTYSNWKATAGTFTDITNKSNVIYKFPNSGSSVTVSYDVSNGVTSKSCSKSLSVSSNTGPTPTPTSNVTPTGGPTPGAGSATTCSDLGRTSVKVDKWEPVFLSRSQHDKYLTLNKPANANYVIVSNYWSWSGDPNEKQSNERHQLNTQLGSIFCKDFGDGELGSTKYFCDELKSSYSNNVLNLHLDFKGEDSPDINERGSHNANVTVEWCGGSVSATPTPSVTPVAGKEIKMYFDKSSYTLTSSGLDTTLYVQDVKSNFSDYYDITLGCDTSIYTCTFKSTGTTSYRIPASQFVSSSLISLPVHLGYVSYTSATLPLTSNASFNGLYPSNAVAQVSMVQQQRAQFEVVHAQLSNPSDDTTDYTKYCDENLPNTTFDRTGSIQVKVGAGSTKTVKNGDTLNVSAGETIRVDGGSRLVRCVQKNSSQTDSTTVVVNSGDFDANNIVKLKVVTGPATYDSYYQAFGQGMFAAKNVVNYSSIKDAGKKTLDNLAGIRAGVLVTKTGTYQPSGIDPSDFYTLKYTNYTNSLVKQLQGNIDKSSPSTLSQAYSSSQNFHYINGNVTFSNPTYNKSIVPVIFVNGSVTITPSVEKVDGIIIATGKIDIQSASNNSDNKRLLINGTLVSGSADDLKISRNVKSFNPVTSPSVEIVYPPEVYFYSNAKSFGQINIYATVID